MIVLYSGSTCPFSHQSRFLLCEKNIDFQIRDIAKLDADEVSIMNPSGESPILVERELLLYESNVIMEYLDERHPHPQLIPYKPQDKARFRLYLYNLELELYSQMHILESTAKGKQVNALKEKAREHIRDRLLALVPSIARKKYIVGDDFSILDIALAPLFWRLQKYNIRLPKDQYGMVLDKYAQRLFIRPSFLESLTHEERAMRL
ncbi:MAG: glutathione S-transferase N-terminal domain-containing protein [Gammaproteobacteria bacterium]|nr:glutathione S-transferase N-terminal domain-containing protein [Gammaproteobacteria bacterium]